ncbi:MAG: 1-acyl-sn-glycerol-3-phosphate acyltransferase [Anaerolineales bacterium]|nr:MAG: 1-acyl-sn-glycerol-3-phosphate acyltransferase [Anaerolineales bacterium]
MMISMKSKNRISRSEEYDHQALENIRRTLRWMLKHIGFRILAKYEGAEGLENFPAEGPVIVMINHIAFIDPIVVLGTLPRNVVPLAKIEVYRVPVFGIFPKLWQVIPVRRQEFDRQAIRQALGVLKAGECILMAPEGTRSPALQQGKEGIAYLGVKSGAPIIPVAVTGSKGFPTFNPLRWLRTGAFVKVGRAFRFRSGEDRPDSKALRLMTDEAMYVLAELLPEDHRGVYSDLSRATTQTIEFV